MKRTRELGSMAIACLCFFVVPAMPQQVGKVLLIIRDAKPAASDVLEWTITKEAGVMKEMLQKAGLKVELASPTGESWGIPPNVLNPDRKLSDVKVADYRGFVIPLNFHELPVQQMLARAADFADQMRRRRTVREFDSRPVPREIIEQCIRAACSAPSGANQQPWRFVAVSDQAVKKRIREAAETEEREFYRRRASEEWLEALAPLGTDEHKPFLEIAPWLIAIFIERFGIDEHGGKRKRYYPDESVGIATGLLIAALHLAGLATLTHTPSPMKFLNDILGRLRDRERPFLLLVAGYPAPGCRVPDIQRMPFEAVAQFR